MSRDVCYPGNYQFQANSNTGSIKFVGYRFSIYSSLDCTQNPFFIGDFSVEEESCFPAVSPYQWFHPIANTTVELKTIREFKVPAPAPSPSPPSPSPSPPVPSPDTPTTIMISYRLSSEAVVAVLSILIMVSTVINIIVIVVVYKKLRKLPSAHFEEQSRLPTNAVEMS